MEQVPDEQLRDVHARVVRLAAVQALSSDDLEFINTQLHTVVDTALSSRTSVAAVMSIQQLLASVIELFFTRVIQPYPLPPALIGVPQRDTMALAVPVAVVPFDVAPRCRYRSSDMGRRPRRRLLLSVPRWGP